MQGGAGSFKIKMAPIPLTWLSWLFLIGWDARERRQIVLVHRTLADKVRQDDLRSSTVRFRPTSPDLVADLSTAHKPTSEDFLSAEKKSASVRRPIAAWPVQRRFAYRGKFQKLCNDQGEIKRKRLCSRLALLATKNKSVVIALSSSNLYSETLHENLPVARAKQLDRSMNETTRCKKATGLPG